MGHMGEWREKIRSKINGREAAPHFRNAWVGGSNPSCGTNKSKIKSMTYNAVTASSQTLIFSVSALCPQTG